MIGWIVRNFAYVDEQSDQPVLDATPPWVKIENLAAGKTLELAWWDDHRGCLMPGQRPTTTNGTFNVQAPATETGGYFGKSIAFLIQPTGYTPEKQFAPLPNEMIGQIVIENPLTIHEETPGVYTDTLKTFAFQGKVEQAIDLDECYFRWDFGDGSQYTIPNPWTDPPVKGNAAVSGGTGRAPKHEYTGVRGWNNAYEVKVDVYADPQGEQRISGDVIHVRADKNL